MREGNAPRGAEGKCRMHHSYDFLVRFTHHPSVGWQCVVRRCSNNTRIGETEVCDTPELALKGGKLLAARNDAQFRAGKQVMW